MGSRASLSLSLSLSQCAARQIDATDLIECEQLAERTSGRELTAGEEIKDIGQPPRISTPIDRNSNILYRHGNHLSRVVRRPHTM